jgi:hypothetical protein
MRLTPNPHNSDVPVHARAFPGEHHTHAIADTSSTLVVKKKFIPV